MKRTFKVARAELFEALRGAGWVCSAPTLKVPHATHSGGAFRVWFKAQAIYSTEGNSHTLTGARSLHLRDTRTIDPARFVGWCERLATMSAAAQQASREAAYRSCACRDCFELTIGLPGEYCSECVEAGCPDSQGQECKAPEAYSAGEQCSESR